MAKEDRKYVIIPTSKVEDIDFRTGVIFDVTVKGAGEVVDKTGILSAPQLDIIKDYLGDRTDGLLFENPKANSRIINAELEKQFPPDYLTKKSKARGTYTSTRPICLRWMLALNFARFRRFALHLM